MHKRLLIVSSLALGSALLFSNGVTSASAQNKNISDLQPKSGWSVARINSKTSEADSYCALSRQYDQGLILTLGRNAGQEYSLAVDFQSAKLNTKRAYPITLQPGPGQIRAYEMMPASQRAIVIRLGYDDSFFDALEQSGALKAEIDNVTYQFQVPSFSAGKADLNNCLAGLKNVKPKQPETKVAAKEFSTKDIVTDKIVPAVPAVPVAVKEVKNVEPPKLAQAIKVTPQPAPKVERASKVIPSAKKIEPVVAPKIISSEAIMVPPPVKVNSTPSKAIEMARVSSEQKVPRAPVGVPNVAPTPIKQATKIETSRVVSKAPTIQPRQIVRSNNDALLPKNMVSKNVRSSAAVSQRIGQTAIQKQQRDALNQLRADNERLNKALQTQVVQPASNMNAQNAEAAALQKQIDQLQNELIQAKVGPNAIDEKLKSDVEKLRQENQQLKMAMKVKSQAQIETAKRAADAQKVSKKEAADSAAAENIKAELEKQKRIERKFAQAKISPEPRAPKPDVATDKTPDANVMRQLSNLKAENDRLSAALQGQERKLSSFDARAPAANKELEEIRAQVKMLQEENIKLSQDTRKARGQIDTAVFETGNQALGKMKEYERKLEAARSDNRALSREIEELRQMQEKGLLSAAGGDWDLEKSTKRYNEAEREIKRLGMLLEQQRVAHRQEKSELEGMLFDPAVTDAEQRRRLRELELQLASAERELSASGRGLPQRPSIPRSPVDERVTLGSTLTPAPNNNGFAAQQRENLEIQRLNNKVARQNQQLQAYNQAERMAPNPKPIVTAQTLAPRRPIQQAPVPQLMRAAPRAPIAQQPAPRAPIPQVRASAPVEAGFGQRQIQQLLSSAGVPLEGSISKQGNGQYRWSAGSVVGQAQIIPVTKAGSVDQFAEKYIAKAKQSCAGDFASLPSNSTGQGRAFEVACISASRSTSSSLIFTQRGRDVVAIAHESSAENMDAAMDARDRIAAKL